jgi:hypothetical protein
MRVIHKKIVTDEDMRPVAVQIDYADWLEIERLLQLRVEDSDTTDLSRYSGLVRLSEDPLDYQARVRGEWP